MKSRRAARRLALDVLYEAEIRGILPEEAWDLSARHQHEAGDEADEFFTTEVGSDLNHFARRLVAGVQEHGAAIDELITRHADRWALDRMPVIDRTLLRIAIFELLWGDDAPVAVVINEAVELAKEYSTKDSGRFVNGLLGKIAESRGDS